MRVLVLSLNYAPEPTGFAPHATALCEHLAGQGHEATVLTGFPFAPRWARWPEYRGQLVSRQLVNGVDVNRLTHFISRRPSHLLGRLLMEGSFCVGALPALISRWRRRPEVILYVGAQSSLGCLARLAAWAWRIPYVVMITDFAAQAARDVGIVRSGLLQDLLGAVEYFGYRRAEAATVLFDDFREALVARGYPERSVHVVRDSVDLDQTEDPSALAAAVERLKSMPEERRSMGARNRSYAETHFDRRQIVATQEGILCEAASRAGQVARPAFQW